MCIIPTGLCSRAIASKNAVDQPRVLRIYLRGHSLLKVAPDRIARRFPAPRPSAHGMKEKLFHTMSRIVPDNSARTRRSSSGYQAHNIKKHPHWGCVLKGAPDRIDSALSFPASMPLTTLVLPCTSSCASPLRGAMKSDRVKKCCRSTTGFTNLLERA